MAKSALTIFVITKQLVSWLAQFKFMFALTSLVWLTNVWAQSIPEFNSRLIDLTNSIPSQQQEGIENKLINLERNSNNVGRMAILIVNKLENTTIEDYAVKVFEQWKIGRQGVDNGILLLISKQDKLVRIEVGYGFEGVITDLKTKRIINTLTPYFARGEFANGINIAIDQLWQLAEQTDLAEQVNDDLDGLWSTLAVICFYLIFIFGSLKLAAYIFPSSSAIYFLASYLFQLPHNFYLILTSVAIAFISYCLLFGFPKPSITTRNRHTSRRNGGWGGGFGSGSRSGGLGGGGRSGGGGASGKW